MKLTRRFLPLLFFGFLLSACQNPHSSAARAATFDFTETIQALQQADTEEAANQTLMEIVAETGTGVYDPRGQAIVAGAERGADDFYLYDFEVEVLAQAYLRGDSWSLADLAVELIGFGIGFEDERQTVDLLRLVLKETVVSAMANPDDPLSLVPLMVRELGLRHEAPYDISADVATEEIEFDALQRWLILSDVLIGAAQDSGTTAITIDKSRGLLSLRSVEGGPCDFGGDVSKERKFGKFWLSLVPYVKAFLKLGLPFADMFHGIVLGLMIDVRVEEAESVLGTHYGPAENHPRRSHHPKGKNLKAVLSVNMVADVEDVVAECGALLGYVFPKKGGVPDVPVDWTGGMLAGVTDAYARLLTQGEIVREDTKTGADGKAILEVKPNDEPYPGVGTLESESGLLRPVVSYVTTFGNTLAAFPEGFGWWGENIFWDVERHDGTGLGLRLGVDPDSIVDFASASGAWIFLNYEEYSQTSGSLPPLVYAEDGCNFLEGGLAADALTQYPSSISKPGHEAAMRLDLVVSDAGDLATISFRGTASAQPYSISPSTAAATTWSKPAEDLAGIPLYVLDVINNGDDEIFVDVRWEFSGSGTDSVYWYAQAFGKIVKCGQPSFLDELFDFEKPVSELSWDSVAFPPGRSQFLISIDAAVIADAVEGDPPSSGSGEIQGKISFKILN